MKTRYQSEAVYYYPNIANSYNKVSERINLVTNQYSESGEVEVIDISTVLIDQIAYVNITLKVTEYEPWEIE